MLGERGFVVQKNHQAANRWAYGSWEGQRETLAFE
jgi:hypothetical protein